MVTGDQCSICGPQWAMPVVSGEASSIAVPYLARDGRRYPYKETRSQYRRRRGSSVIYKICNDYTGGGGSSGGSGSSGGGGNGGDFEQELKVWGRRLVLFLLVCAFFWLLYSAWNGEWWAIGTLVLLGIWLSD